MRWNVIRRAIEIEPWRIRREWETRDQAHSGLGACTVRIAIAREVDPEIVSFLGRELDLERGGEVHRVTEEGAAIVIDLNRWNRSRDPHVIGGAVDAETGGLFDTAVLHCDLGAAG